MRVSVYLREIKMKTKYLIEVKVLFKFGGPGPSFVYNSCSSFPCVRRKFLSGLLHPEIWYSCHARKGHASPDRATVGAQNCFPILSTWSKFWIALSPLRRFSCICTARKSWYFMLKMSMFSRDLHACTLHRERKVCLRVSKITVNADEETLKAIHV